MIACSTLRLAIRLFVLAGVSSNAAPSVTNPGFEDGLTGWTSSGVGLETKRHLEENPKVYAGTTSLALRGGFIQQTVSGLAPGELHTLALAYQDDTGPSWILSHARILINGVAIGEIHNGQNHEYLDCGGLEFTAPSDQATLRIESLDPGPEGLLIDEIRIVTGGLPAPPEHDWTSLTVMDDARGGRQLDNGGFEAETRDPATDPHNSGPANNPHLCGDSLPGWLVTRENVDIIEYSANAPEGFKALDTGGHGPGGIAQTVSGLQPGAVYTLSFRYARHASWGTDAMTGEVHANGRLAAELVRSSAQTWETGYDLKEIPALASAEGKLTIEIRSTTTDQGGNIIYDDVRLSEGGDGFAAWATHHGVAADPAADDDRDGLNHGLEFLFGSDPAVAGSLPMPDDGFLHVPLSGLALSQGYTHTLMTSRTLEAWQVATEPGSGLTLIEDTAGPGVDGEQVFAVDPGEPRLFWTHLIGPP